MIKMLSIAAAVAAVVWGCRGERGALLSAPAPDCQNDRVVLSNEVIVIAPHPDDEVLGFAGVIPAATASGRRVHVVVTTDGQAHCSACVIWKRGRAVEEGAAQCNRDELDELGRHRRTESLAGLASIRES